MKLVIEIDDNEYMGIKEYPNNITSYPVTIHLYDAVRNGTPLDKIRAEIADLDDADYDYEGYYKAITDAVTIIDKYKAESEE